MKYRAKAYNLRYGEFDERLAWCRATFGPESHSTWMPKYSYEFRFQNEDDLIVYMLRWG